MYGFLELKLKIKFKIEFKTLELFSFELKFYLEFRKEKQRFFLFVCFVCFLFLKSNFWKLFFPLRSRSWSNTWWLYSKNSKLWRENLYFSENRLCKKRNVMCAKKYNDMCYTCGKGFNSSFNWAVSNNYKYQIFTNVLQISHINKNCNL